MKVVINACYGGFSLSYLAVERYKELSPNSKIDENVVCYGNIKRNDPLLVQIVEELGEKSSGKYSKLKVVEIPDDVDWVLQEYDGKEWIAENHRTWE